MRSFLDHVVEATLPVLKICLLGAVGAGMARVGILDQSGRRTLSKLIYCLFTPALTFTKLAPVLSGAHLVLWMPLAVNMFFSVFVGLLLGGLLLVVVRPPPELNRHVIVATALGNAGNLPLVLVVALIRETGGKLFGDEVLSEDLAIAYVAIGIWAATITHFTIGSELLKLNPVQQQPQQDPDTQALLGPEAKGPSPAPPPPAEAADSGPSAAVLRSKLEDSSSGMHAAAAGKKSVSTDEGDASSCVVELGPVRGLPHHHQQQQQQAGLLVGHREGSSSAHSLRSVSGSADCLVLALPLADDSSSKGTRCTSCGTQRPAAAAGGAAWEGRLCGADNAMPLAAVGQQAADSTGRGQHTTQQQDGHAQEHARLLGSAAGPSSSDGAWQQAPSTDSRSGSGGGGGSRLKRMGQVVLGVASQLSSPPMIGCMLAVAVGLTRPVRNQLFAPGGKLLMIQDCIAMFGDCCIPCLLLMLGATLSKGPGKACPPLRVVAGVGAARLLLLPLVGTAWLVLAKKLGWYHAPDKMFVLVMLIQNAVPTALNVHTLATLHGNKEGEMGAMLFWQYLAACITLPAALSFFLWLLNTPAMSSA